MFLFLVLTGASLSILIMGYKDVVKQLREELDMLNSSMQIMELQGKVLNEVFSYTVQKNIQYL